MNISPLHHWGDRNNPPESAAYSEGFWYYISTIYRLCEKYEVAHAEVLDDYVITTPPPSESLTLPLVELTLNRATVAIPCDFGRPVGAWIVHVCPSEAYVSTPLPYLFPAASSGHPDVTGSWPEAVKGPPYDERSPGFAIVLNDECDVDTLLRVIARGRTQSLRE